MGLRSLQAGLRGILLPRMPSPRESEFSENKRLLRRPEREYAKQTVGGWLFGYLLLPVAIVKDWILAPLYNHVFAELVDEYVKRQLHNRAFGNDLPGLVLQAVTNHPMGLDGVKGGAPRAHCPEKVREDVVDRAGKNSQRAVDALRAHLALDYPVGPDLNYFIKDAMRGNEEAAKVIIHTTYFDSGQVQETIATQIHEPKDRTEVVAATGADDQPGPPEPPDRLATGNQLKFVAWLLRGVIRLGVFLSPVLLLGLFGLLVLYPYSRASALAWAADEDAAVALAVEELPPQSNTEGKTPLVVRWWVARRLQDPSLDDRCFGDKLKNVHKRIAFYSLVGQKFAQLGDADNAIKAFGLARKEIAHLSGSPEERGAIWQLALGLPVASRSLPKDDWKRIEKELGLPGVTGDPFVEQLQHALEQGPGQFAGSHRRAEYSQLKKWTEVSATTKEVADWATIDPAGRTNLSRQAVAVHGLVSPGAAVPVSLQSTVALGVAGFTPRFPPAIQLQRLALVLCFGKGNRIDRVHLARNEFRKAVEGFLREAEQLSQKEKSKILNKWLDGLVQTLAVAERIPEIRGELLEQAVRISRLFDGLEQTGKASPLLAGFQAELNDPQHYAVLAKALLCRSLSGRRTAEEVDDLLAEARERVTRQEGRFAQVFLLRKLANCVARLGRFAEAKQLAEGWGNYVRLEVALGILENELASSGHHRLVLWSALNEDLVP